MIMWLTIISCFLTLISIVCTVISIVNARDAKQYKESVVNLTNAIEIGKLTEKYKDAHLSFLRDTRPENWFKGKNINSIIAPMESVLTEIAIVYPLMDDPDSLRSLVNSASARIRKFDECNKDDRKDTFAYLGEIDNRLHAFLFRQTEKALK